MNISLTIVNRMGPVMKPIGFNRRDVIVLVFRCHETTSR